jgi:hypothetical protein
MMQLTFTTWRFRPNHPILGLSTRQPKGNTPMFVRAVWRVKRLVDIKQTLREMDVPSTRDADLLGISGPDFSKMTRSLFDR